MSDWTPDQDRDQRDVAAALSRRHAPYWWVMWSFFFREWVGFYLGPHTVAPLRHADPDQLAKRMRHVMLKVAAKTPDHPPARR